MHVLNVDLSLNIFIKISDDSRISSVRCLLLDVLILILFNTMFKHMAIIFILPFVNFLLNPQVIVDNFDDIGLDMRLVSGAELHHGVRESLADAGQELFVVLRVEALKVVTGLVVALPHVASQVAGVCHQDGGE